MQCRFCGYPKLSRIKIWEDKKTKTTRLRLGCLSCGRKFEVELKGEVSKTGASRISEYARSFLTEKSKTFR